MDLKEESKKEFQRQCDPETSECECFFHYTDELLFEVGFQKGYELAMKEIEKKSKENLDN